MTNQALAEIVAVEKEIQARLTDERSKAADWLAAERERIGREIERDLAEAQREFRRTIAAAEAEAGNEVDSLLREAEEYAARLKNLPDQALRERIASRLSRLLPEEPG